MDLFLSVHLQKQYLLITLLINLLILFKWTLLERSLRSLLRSLVIESLIDNIFVERLGSKLKANGEDSLNITTVALLSSRNKLVMLTASYVDKKRFSQEKILTGEGFYRRRF